MQPGVLLNILSFVHRSSYIGVCLVHNDIIATPPLRCELTASIIVMVYDEGRNAEVNDRYILLMLYWFSC